MRRRAVDRYRGPTTLGIDVSHWQGEIKWPEVARSTPPIRFAVVRTGDGRDRDRRAVENLVGAHAAGLLVGVYHYFRADRGAAVQLEVVRGVLRDAGAIPLMFVALDIEDGADDDLTGGLVPGKGELPVGPELVATEALKFLEGVERDLRQRAIVYTGQWFHWVFSQARPQLAEPFGRWPLWVPSYHVQHPRMPVDRTGKGFPWPTWTIHQFTSQGRVRGIDTRVDVNRFRGDHDALLAWAADRCGAPEDPNRD